MRVRLFSEYRGVATPAALLIAARIANMLLGLAVIPVLLTFLGTEHFAAWALLLALGAAFSLLELSMPPTYVRAVAPLMHAGRIRDARQVTANALCIVFLSFGIASVPLIAAASLLVKAVGLPDGELLSATELVVFVFIASSLRALLQFGSLKLNAARKFGALATSSFLQSFASNLAAALAAIISGKLEYAVIAFWAAQLLALTAVGLATQLTFPDRETEHVGPSRSGMRELLKHALPLQVYDWAQVVSYQFDKFVIAALAGLPAVALYEVGNRSVLALRSIPASGIDSFLATAAIGQADRESLWREYLRIRNLAAIATLVFIVAPLAVSPAMLYAWTGGVGYEARWIFMCLSIGAAFSIAALPAAAMVQAAGRSDLQARAAIVSLAVNVPLSFLLVVYLGPVGAASGTAVAMSLGAVLLIVAMYRAYGRRAGDASAEIRNSLPAMSFFALLCCVTWFFCEAWVQQLPTNGATASTRATATVIAMLGYFSLLSALILTSLRRESAEWLRRRLASIRPDGRH